MTKKEKLINWARDKFENDKESKLFDFVYEECGEYISNKVDEYDKIRKFNSRLPVSGDAMRNILNHCKGRT